MNEFSGKSIKRLLRQAIRALRTNQHDDAIRFTNEVIARQPDNARALALQFTTYYKSEQMEKAHRIGDSAAELNPASQYILNNQACLHLGLRKPEKADKLLNNLIDQYGETAQWLYNLGLAKIQLEKYESAVECFNKVINIEPGHHKAVLQLSSAQIKLGLHEDATHSLNLLRLITENQPKINACYIHHAILNNLISKESAERETAMWGSQFIPRNKEYSHSNTIENDFSLKIGFIIGPVSSLDWMAMIKPLIDELAAMGNDIIIYWHRANFLPIIRTKNISVINSHNDNDADFARKVKKDNNNVIVDIGGMGLQTRERPLGLRLAKKQYGWLLHTGLYSTKHVEILENRLGERAFAFMSKKQAKPTETLPKSTIAAIGCQSGLPVETIETWSKILQQLPRTALMMDAIKPAIQHQLIKRFKQFDISDKRLKFSEHIHWQPGNLVLDNLTNNSLSLAINALIQGVNLITLQGNLFPAQRTAKVLQLTGNDQWICLDKQHYIELAVKLAKSKTKNKQLDSQIQACGLLDMPAFARHFHTQLLDE